MALSTDQYGYLIDPLVPITDAKGTTIKDGFLRVFIAGSSTPIITYRNYDGAVNEKTIELDNSGRCKYPIIVNKSIAYKVVVYDAQHSQDTPIISVDQMFAIGASVTVGAGATVVTGLDGFRTKPDGFVDASVVGTDGYVAIDHTLVEDDLDTDAKVTAVENDRYIPLLNEDVDDPDSKMTLGRLWQWVLGKIKSLSTTITTFRSGDVIPVDGPSGTAKMDKDSLLQETANNALGSIHNLATTATEDDLVAGNFLAIDIPGAGGTTKKLPGNLVAPKSVQERLIVSIAPVFDEAQNYKANECVMYNGRIHRFTADHPAGPWIGTDATGSNVTGNFVHRSRETTEYIVDTKFLTSKDGFNPASYDGKILMGRLNGLRKEIPVTIISEEEGYYIASDGVTKNSNATFSIRTIDVTGADSIHVKCYTAANSVAQVVFKDSNSVNVGALVISAISGYNDADVDVPPTATKALISHSIYGGRTCDVLAFEVVPDFEVYDEKYSEYKFVDVNWSEAGVYLFSDGSLSTIGGSAWKNSGKLPIEGVKKIRITNRIVSTILYAKFLDANDSEITPRQGGTNNADNLLVVDVPPTAKSVILSVIDYTRSGNHSIEFAYKQTNKKNDNNGLNDCFAKKLTDVVMIPIFGQSLSVGSAATPCITKKPKYKAGIQFNTGLLAAQKAVDYFKEFMPLFEQDLGVTIDSAGTGETAASGCCEKILELIQSEDGISVHSELWGDKKFLFVCCGSGSKTIADLTNDYLQGFLNAVQGAKNICDANDKSLNVPCWIWIQGETDQKQHTTTGDYKTSLLSLQASIVSGVKSITRQTNDPQCITSQCGAQNIVLPSDMSPTYTTEAVDVPTAQMQVVRDNNAFSFACPSYILDHSSAEYIHLSNFGSRMMGLYFGKAVKAILDGKKFGGILPKTYSVSGNDLVIKCDVPCKPLEIDTEWVKEVSNYGFSIVNSSNVNLLTSVEVFGDEITLHCSASPVGCIVYYGVDGTAYRDGRVQGARGNVRDSAGYIFSGSVGNERICLHNWLPMFKSAIASNSGNID